MNREDAKNAKDFQVEIQKTLGDLGVLAVQKPLKAQKTKRSKIAIALSL